MGIEQLSNDPDAGRVEAGMDGERFAGPERAQDALASADRAETLTLDALQRTLAAQGRERIGADERNWHADDQVSNLAASGMVRTSDGVIAEYRLGRDGTYALRTWVKDASAPTAEELETQIDLETALLAAKSRGEAGAACLEWAATLRAPETLSVTDRLRSFRESFRKRLNIDDKAPEVDAEKPGSSLAA